MEEWCPNCMDEEYEVIEHQEDFEIGSVTMWWKCKCTKCGQLFEIVREYNLDPYHSYTRPWEDE